MAGFLVELAIKSTLVLAAAWLAAAMLRRQSAAVRHLVWTAAFAALLAMPFLSASLPALRFTVSESLLPADRLVVTNAPTSPDIPAAAAARSQTGAPLPGRRAPRGPDWPLILMLGWAAGTAAGLARMALAWLAVRRIRRSARAFPSGDLPYCARILGIGHGVEVLETRDGLMPMTFGLFRPAVLMPAGANEWSGERRRYVLLHELAHVRRGDAATHLMARLVLCLHWWNPLAWKAWGEFLKERERSADDLVLSAGAPAPEYAGQLLEIARSMQAPLAAGWAALAMARPSQLEGRLLAILDRKCNRKPPRRRFAAAVLLLAAGIAVPLAALQAQRGTLAEVPADADALIRAAGAQRNPAMLEAAAEAATASREYDLARKLLESALSIRAGIYGRQSPEYGVGLSKLGEMERNRGRFQEAQARYVEALSLLSGRPESAPALIYMGIAALGKKDTDQAVDYFQRAQAADAAHAGPALMWLAVARERQQLAQEADFLYQQALSAQDAGSEGAAVTLELYSRFLRAQGREEEANDTRYRAAAIRGHHSRQAQPAPKPAASVHRVGGGVTAPVLVSKLEPEYTEEARIARYEGTAVLYAEIGLDGVPRNLRIMRGVGLGLNGKAVEAVSQWRFKPGMKDGNPVVVAATIEINWRLL